MHLYSYIVASLSLLAAASPVAVVDDAAAEELTDELARRAGNSANDVDNKICKPVTLVFARGSFEPGNVGILIGPQLIRALSTTYSGKFAAQGVAYPADLAGNSNPINNPGIAPMIANIAAAIANCPSTKIVLGGYSQGGLVVHGTLKKLTTSQVSYIKAVVLFGDEGKSDTITAVPSSLVYENCHQGDAICEKENMVITAAHLNYGRDAPAAAAFVKSKISV